VLLLSYTCIALLFDYLYSTTVVNKDEYFYFCLLDLEIFIFIHHSGGVEIIKLDYLGLDFLKIL